LKPPPPPRTRGRTEDEEYVEGNEEDEEGDEDEEDEEEQFGGGPTTTKRKRKPGGHGGGRRTNTSKVTEAVELEAAAARFELPPNLDTHTSEELWGYLLTCNSKSRWASELRLAANALWKTLPTPKSGPKTTTFPRSDKDCTSMRVLFVTAMTPAGALKKACETLRKYVAQRNGESGGGSSSNKKKQKRDVADEEDAEQLQQVVSANRIARIFHLFYEEEPLGILQSIYSGTIPRTELKIASGTFLEQLWEELLQHFLDVRMELTQDVDLSDVR
jgi:hypothetical protein